MKRPSAEAATPLAAIACMFGAGLLFSFLDASAKYLVQGGMEAPFVAWARFAVHLALVFVLLRGWRSRSIYRAASVPLQVLRGCLLFSSTFFNFLALQTLQLAETMSIFFLAPMMITALAGPLLGEWAGWRRWLAVLVGFAGVLVITRPGFGTLEIGHLYSIAATLGYSFYAIMTRRMGARESAESLIFYSALAPVVLMAPALPYTASLPPDLLHWILLLSLGFYGGFGHWLIIKAHRRATASALAPYPYLQMVWMIGFGYAVFGDLPDGFTIAGALVIVASGLYIVHREHTLRLASRSSPNTESGELAKRL